ncbi:MAG: hypothetical protein IT423_04335, partial [Pirellulaceae bacterium]|nr:hypothetical protein [Pirellulaceae bacterium]
MTVHCKAYIFLAVLSWWLCVAPYLPLSSPSTLFAQTSPPSSAPSSNPTSRTTAPSSSTTEPVKNVPLAALDPLQFKQELDRLDAICARLGLNAEQQLMQGWLPVAKTDTHRLYLPVLPDPLVNRADRTAAQKTAHDNWLKYFAAARRRHAQYWYEQAQQSLAQGDEWAAYQSLWRAAREDSTHPDVKRVLAPLLSALTIKSKPRVAKAAHELGWAPGTYLQLESTNFKLISRADAATTTALAQQLENFFALWTQTFYPLWAPPNVTSARLAGRNTNFSRRQQMSVVLCQDRQDYLKTLRVSETNIDVSVGYYNPDRQLAFFYPDPNLQ